MLMGMALGLTATLGKRPPLTVREILPGLAWLLAAIAAGTVLAGVSAGYAGSITQVQVGGGWAAVIPRERQLPFVVVACAHFATYLTAVAGTVVLCGWAGRLRRRKAGAIGMSAPAANLRASHLGQVSTEAAGE
jgi:hypothetical protein